MIKNITKKFLHKAGWQLCKLEFGHEPFYFIPSTLAPPFVLDFKKNIHSVVEKNQANPWHGKSCINRPYHRDVIEWVLKNVTPDSTLVESGCGIGQTFVILSQFGFKKFKGIEIDEKTCQAGKDLCSIYDLNECELINGDGIQCALSLKNINAYLALNWSFHTEDMKGIIDSAAKMLVEKGKFILDIKNENWNASHPHMQHHSLLETLHFSEPSFKLIKVDAHYEDRIVIYFEKK